MLLHFLELVGLSLLGTAIYTLWAVRKHIKDFKPKIFIGKNKGFWIWCTCFQVVMSFTAVKFPEVIDGLGQFIPIKFDDPKAFIISGWALAMAANQVSKPEQKIGQLKK